MNGALSMLLSVALLADGQAPDAAPLPPPADTPSDDDPAPAKPTPRRRRAPRKQKAVPKRAPTPAPAPRAKAPRRRAAVPAPAARAPLRRPDVTDVNRHTVPLAVGQRGWLAAAQLGCSVLGAAGALGAAGGAALLARTLDRPAATLAHPRVPVGGVMPLLAGITVGTAATAVCVGGLGFMSERRILAPAAATLAVAGMAVAAGGMGTLVILWPADRTGRNLAVREFSMAGTLAAFALLAPLGAVAAWHLGAALQEWRDARTWAEETAAAKKALADDALKERQRAERAAAAAPVPPPEPAPPVEEKPAAPAPPAPPPAPPQDPAIPADPLQVPPETAPLESVPALPE
ncbi:MAG: hypothetical protein HY904_25410 [Deltaproteobacteria bacterium]|nr:hypothetical protein [Deltaproteobacteria bacterium]